MVAALHPLSQREPVSHHVDNGRAAAFYKHLDRARAAPKRRTDAHWGAGYATLAPAGSSSAPLRAPTVPRRLSRTAQPGRPWPVYAAEVEQMQRGLAEMHRRRQGFLRSSGGGIGPGRRGQPPREQRRARVGAEDHPRAHLYGRGLPNTAPATKPTPLWQAAREQRDHVPMGRWLQTKQKAAGPSPSDAAGFTVDLTWSPDPQVVTFTSSAPGEDQEMRLNVTNVTGGPLRLRLRRKPTSDAFDASLSFPSGAPVAAGLSASLLILCRGDRVGKQGASDYLEFDVEGRTQKLIVPLRAWVALPSAVSREEMQRRRAAQEVAALR